jgi:hypothetical protein
MVDALTTEFHSGTEEAQVSAVSEEAQVSAVSWAAIVAGGVASAALTLALLAFGAGMSLSALSPWSNSEVSPSTFNRGAGIYLVVIAVMASSIGGYLAGRLRTKWVGVHTHEVYFRDRRMAFSPGPLPPSSAPQCWLPPQAVSWAARRPDSPKLPDLRQINRLGPWPASWICCCAQIPLQREAMRVTLRPRAVSLIASSPPISARGRSFPRQTEPIWRR